MLSFALLLFYIFYDDYFINWNSMRVATKGVSSLIKDHVTRHNVSFLSLLKPRVSGARELSIIRKLDFQGFHVEIFVGFFSGIWIMWHTNVLDIQILVSH